MQKIAEEYGGALLYMVLGGLLVGILGHFLGVICAF